MTTVLIVLAAAAVAWMVVDLVRTFRRRPVRPQDGCTGCFAPLCDVVVDGREGYCWSCIDGWLPSVMGSLDDLGVRVLPGRERWIS